MLLFQALCLGLAASLVGLLGGYALSRGVFHQSTGYLAEAFTLGTRTVLTAQPLLLALIAGVLATVLASAVPLLDLRRAGALDAVYREDGVPRKHALPWRAAGICDRRRGPACGRDRAVRGSALAGADRLRAAGAGERAHGPADVRGRAGWRPCAGGPLPGADDPAGGAHLAAIDHRALARARRHRRGRAVRERRAGRRAGRSAARDRRLRPQLLRRREHLGRGAGR